MRLQIRTSKMVPAHQMFLCVTPIAVKVLVRPGETLAAAQVRAIEETADALVAEGKVAVAVWRDLPPVAGPTPPAA